MKNRVITISREFGSGGRTIGKMLAEELRKFVEYKSGNKIDPKKAFGVNAGMNEKVTFIGFSTDSSKNVYCTIGKFDGSGVIVESAKYTFAREYNYSLEYYIYFHILYLLTEDDLLIHFSLKVFDIILFCVP